MINFKKIRWCNFLSTGNTFTEIQLDRSPSTLIVGENGAGKSTILDALCFALYGKPFRKINKSQLINTINNKSLIVEIEFEIGKSQYKIIRGIKPSVFEVYQNGTLINQNAKVDEYQDMLEKHILKINYKSFSQIVILGSASFTPFMQLSTPNRREVIEDLLDIQVFSTMNTLLKTKVQQNKEAILKSDMSIQLTQQRIDLFKANIKELKANNQDLIDSHLKTISDQENKLKDIIFQMKSIEDKVPTLTSQIKDGTKTRKKLNSLNELFIKLSEKQKQIQETIDFFEKNDNCPTCTQVLSTDFKQQKTTDKHNHSEEVRQAILKLKEEIKAVESRIKEIETIESKLDKLRLNHNELYHQELMIKSTIASHTKSIESINTQTKKMTAHDDSELLQLQKEYDKGVEFKHDLLRQKEIFDAAAVLLKDTGIKTKIIRQYIPVINKLINKYLSQMDFFVSFELNENFEETIKSRYRDDFSYESFSEGEKLRIDLALLFTWRAVAKLRNSASTNLLIMDEIFDSSLDDNGTEEFLKIINSVITDTNVFIISHKGDALYDKFHSAIKFEKYKGFSRIVI